MASEIKCVHTTEERSKINYTETWHLLNICVIRLAFSGEGRCFSYDLGWICWISVKTLCREKSEFEGLLFNVGENRREHTHNNVLYRSFVLSLIPEKDVNSYSSCVNQLRPSK